MIKVTITNQETNEVVYDKEVIGIMGMFKLEEDINLETKKSKSTNELAIIGRVSFDEVENAAKKLEEGAVHMALKELKDILSPELKGDVCDGKECTCHKSRE